VTQKYFVIFSQQQSDNFSPNIQRVPLANNNRRNTLRDRLYNPQPPTAAAANKGNRNNQQSFFLRSEDHDDEPLIQTRRGTSTIQSNILPPSSYSSHLDNTMSNKLSDPFPSSPSNRNFNPQFVHSSSGNSKKERKKSYPPRAASVNSILRLDPEYSIWDANSAVCRSIPGLTKDQMKLCYKNPDATKMALEGLSLAADECAYQMSKNRWNCSSLQGRLNPHSTQLFQKGERVIINSFYSLCSFYAKFSLLSFFCVVIIFFILPPPTDS
jgi:hypothetical protein